MVDTGPDDLLAGLNQAQLDAVTACGGPVVVLAGAGSGKTRVLTRRIAYRCMTADTDPRRVLALTFTRKAAGELRSRLGSLGMRDDVVAGTFHGIALTQLRSRWAERGIDPPQMLDRKIGFVANLMGRRGGADVLDVVGEIEWARARMIEPERYGNAARAAGRTLPLEDDQMAELMVRFAQEKRRRRVVDFDDLLALAARDLRADPDYAEAVRWRHRHLYVDEFQDVNPLQFDLLSLWRGQRTDVFVVGDPNQAIYGWNGADPSLLRNFARNEPSAAVINLDDNYRSTPQVLTLGRAALGPRARMMAAHRPDGAVPTISAYADDVAEAEGIAVMVRQAASVSSRWSDQAVLVRTNAQLVLIEQALTARGIPVRVKGGESPLRSREVKVQLDVLARAIDLGAEIGALDEELASPPEEQTRGEADRRQNLAALSRLVHEYMTIDPEPTGTGLMAWIATLSADEVTGDADAVELATFHGAKGLEWPVVHVAGLERGYVPIGYAKTNEQLDEEQRLLYVAVTRAESELHLSWAANRTFGTNVRNRQPSPWLDQLQHAVDHLQAGHRPMDWKLKLNQARKQVKPRFKPSDDDDPVFTSLRAWRSGVAKAANVPAYVVFNDQTLRSIAASKPTSKARLAGVAGVGPVKLERYGDQVLDIVAQAVGD